VVAQGWSERSRGGQGRVTCRGFSGSCELWRQRVWLLAPLCVQRAERRGARSRREVEKSLFILRALASLTTTHRSRPVAAGRGVR